MLRLTYRVLHGDDTSDVRVGLADGTTVGDLARALATRCGIELDDDSPTVVDESALHGCPVSIDPSRLAAEAAPRSGATLRVVSGHSASPSPPWWSPVSLDRIGTDVRRAKSHGHAVDLGDADSEAADEAVEVADGDRRTARLAYGSTTIGPARIRIGTAVTVHSTGSVDRLEVDGTPVRGSVRIAHGTLLRVGDTTFAVTINGPLRPPPQAGPWREHGRIPAVVESPDPEPVSLPVPPSADRLPGFPFLSAAVPLLMGAAMWVATHSLAMAGFVLFSVAFVVASGIESRREHRKERRFREQEFVDDLERARDRIGELRRRELERARRDLPSGAEVTRWALEDPTRIWERWDDQPEPLRVRIGDERRFAHDPIGVPAGGRHDLRRQLETTADDLATIERPAWVDLTTSGLALCGQGDEPSAIARSAVMQLVCSLGPEHLELVADICADRAPTWEWLDWLPHHVVRVTGHDPAGRSRSSGPERLVLRLVDRTGDGLDVAALDWDDVAASAATSAPNTHPLCATIWIAGSQSQVPDGIGTVVDVHDRGATVRRSDGPGTPLVADVLALEACEPAARALAPLRAPGEDDAIPAIVDLADVVSDPTMLDDADAVRRAWERNSALPSSLQAPIGLTNGGVMHIDLRADGPHGLVAGTTGSGKSELLRTLVSSLALHHPPDRLTFLLVDYKGGAAFGAVAALPHVVGLVTDLGLAEARRALTSLRAEVRRREHVVAAAGVTDMVEVPSSDASPALVVVVDEFATLATELPDLLDGLLDIAQRGRSLGVHLLLATQRPAGVVTDSIRANLSLRLALRVADEDDSRDVIDVVDAAHLPVDTPGRAVLRLGPTQRRDIQIASTAGTATTAARVHVESLHRTAHAGHVADHPLLADHPPLADDPLLADHTLLADHHLLSEAPPRPGRDEGTTGAVPTTGTQLDRAVRRCVEAAAIAGIEPARRPWVAPLPERISAASLPGPIWAGGLVIGMADLPAEQRQAPVEIDLRSGGGMLVLGAPRSGRSTALRAVAGAALADERCPTQVYALDAGRSLVDLQRIDGPGGHAHAAIRLDDAERTLRLLRTLRRRCRQVEHGKAADPSGPRPQDRVVLLVDGIGAFIDRHERVNRGEAVDLLSTIVTEGPGAGIHTVLSAGRPNEVPPAMLAALDRRLVLRCATVDDVIMIGAADTVGLAAELASPSLPAGRGLYDGALLQIAVSADAPVAPNALDTRSGGPTLGLLASDVERTTLPAPLGWHVPIGVRHDDLRAAVLDLSVSGALIAGPPRSGRSTALRMISEQLVAAHGTASDGTPAGAATGAADDATDEAVSPRVTWIDGHQPDGSVDSLRAVLADARGHLATAHAEPDRRATGTVGSTSAPGTCPLRSVVAIDDLPELLEGPDGTEIDELLDALLRLGPHAGARVVVTGEADSLSRCYSDSVRRLRSTRTGILLRPDPDLHPGLLHTSLPLHDDLTPAAGRGWMVTPDAVVALQLAR